MLYIGFRGAKVVNVFYVAKSLCLKMNKNYDSSFIQRTIPNL